jgi:hypothetical protein
MTKANSPSAAPRRARRKSAPKNWRSTFLAALARTSNVSAAARAAKIDASAVYKARRGDPTFARQWQAALCEGYDNLEMDLLHRLRSGELESRPNRARRRFDNGAALRLLAAHRETVGRQRALREMKDEADIVASINAKIEMIRQREAQCARVLGTADAE